MSFEPFSDTYKFDKSVLTPDFPDYLLEPIEDWLEKRLQQYDLVAPYQRNFSHEDDIRPEFKQTLQLQFKRTLPSELSAFLTDVTSDADFLCNILSYMLQTYCHQGPADKLETILKAGSSAYTVLTTKKDIGPWDVGVFKLGHRVPEVVQKQATEAIDADASNLLRQAWEECYKHNPDPSACVSKSIDFLEGFLRDQFAPGETRTPAISTWVKKFRSNLETLNFKGSTFLEDKLKIIQLVEGTSRIRAEHTTGEGRAATQDEAIYVLHTTIYLWNLMR